MEILKTWEVQQTYTTGKWRDMASVQLHAFGDASESAYGACVYVVIEKEDGNMASKLVLSKVKVAPLKRVTLPRLEL